MAHINDFNVGNNNLYGRKLICNNFSWADGQFLFIYAQHNSSRFVTSTGLFISNSDFVVSFASCFSGPANDVISGDLKTMEVALYTT